MTSDTEATSPASIHEDGEPLVASQLENLLTPLPPPTNSRAATDQIPGFHRPSELLLLKQPEYLIQQLLPADGTTCLTGPSGSGKTFLAVAMASSVATGTDFLGYGVRQGRVIYLAAEGFHGIGRRILAWEKLHTAKTDGWLDVVEPSIVLNETASLQGLAERLEQYRACHGEIALIVVDTLAQTMNGAENDAEPMKAYVRVLEGLAASFGCATLVLHHPTKDIADKSGAGLFRGHGSLYASLQSGLVIKSVGGIIELTQPKNKDDEPAPKTTLRLTPVDLASELGHHTDGRPITSCVVQIAPGAVSEIERPKPGPSKHENRVAAELAILALLKDGPARHRNLKQAVESAVSDPKKWENSLKSALEGLRREGAIRKRDDGPWELVSVDDGMPPLSLPEHPLDLPSLNGAHG